MINTNNRDNYGNKDFSATRDFSIKKAAPQSNGPSETRTVSNNEKRVPNQNIINRNGNPTEQAVVSQAHIQQRQAQTNNASQNNIRTIQSQRPNVQQSMQQTKTINQLPKNNTVNGQMMKTRVDAVDVKASRMEQERIAERKQAERKRKNKNEMSAGGNTVISIVKAIVYIIFIMVISIFLAIAVIKVGNDVFAFVKSNDEIEVTIPENADTETVAAILEANDVISYPKVFCLYAKLRHYDDSYIAGTYTVKPSENYDYLLVEFKPKEVVGTIDITIPEGYTTDEIIDLFVSVGIGTREGFIEEIQNGDFDYWFIDELETVGVSDDRIYRLDGYLFPDTYQFYLASSEWTVINKLLRRFSQIFTNDYRDQCAEVGMTVDEIVTLASIIEKEAAAPSEFFLVSSVFYNRMAAKWTFPRMESDATVVYVIEHETGERNIDLTYDTPYNTYLYEGLPPGPICSPSASAMLAALSPLETNYYYFISNNNVTYFSSTKAEHDAYIAKFKSEAAQSGN